MRRRTFQSAVVRAASALAWVLWLAGCPAPTFDETGKLCSEERRCSPAWACVEGRCRLSGGDGGDGADGGTWVLRRGSSWRYLVGSADSGANWNLPGFDDSAWASGAAPIGYGMTGLATELPMRTAVTSYFRARVNVPAGFSQYELRVRRDDAAVVYVEGTEVFRVGLPAGPVTAETVANVHIAGADETGFVSVALDGGGVPQGDVLLAAEVHQERAASDDMVFDLELLGRR